MTCRGWQSCCFLRRMIDEGCGPILDSINERPRLCRGRSPSRAPFARNPDVSLRRFSPQMPAPHTASGCSFQLGHTCPLRASKRGLRPDNSSQTGVCDRWFTAHFLPVVVRSANGTTGELRNEPNEDPRLAAPHAAAGIRHRGMCGRPRTRLRHRLSPVQAGLPARGAEEG